MKTRKFLFLTVILGGLLCLFGCESASAHGLFAGGATITPVLGYISGGINPDYVRGVLNLYKQDQRFAVYNAQTGIWEPQYVMAEHTLRSIVKVVNGVSQFQIDFQNIIAQYSNNESRLNENDIFVATHIGMFLHVVSTSGSTQYVITHRYTYPNATAFVTDSTNFISGHLNALYNAWLAYKVGTTENFSRIEANTFYYVPTAQQGAVTATHDGSPITEFATPLDGFDPGAGWHQLVNWMELNGRQQNEFYLNLYPDQSNSLKIANTNATTDNVMEFVLTGFIIKNGALVAKNL